jgi:hypothetical protein
MDIQLKSELTIGVFVIRQENILSTDNNRNRWFLYRKQPDGSLKPIGRYKNQKQAVKSTKL